MGKDVGGLFPYNPYVICFPACDFPFQRALIHSVDTWEPSAASSRGGDTLTGRGIRADWPLTPPPKCHFIASWRKESDAAHTHTCTHANTHHSHIHCLTTRLPTHPQPSSYHSTEASARLWQEAVLISVYQKIPNLCWHKPSTWGYQQMQTLVQSGMGIFAPVQRTHGCRQFQRWKDYKKTCKVRRLLRALSSCADSIRLWSKK